MERVLLARALQHPPELGELPRTEVCGQRVQERVAVEREFQDRAEAEQLGHDGTYHRLLPQAAGDVAVRRVELVLTDARVDERALSVHVLRPLLKPVARPARTA